jgi:hypothetical protein
LFLNKNDGFIHSSTAGSCDDGVAATIGEVSNVARRRRVLRETLKRSIGIHLLG